MLFVVSKRWRMHPMFHFADIRQNCVMFLKYNGISLPQNSVINGEKNLQNRSFILTFPLFSPHPHPSHIGLVEGGGQWPAGLCPRCLRQEDGCRPVSLPGKPGGRCQHRAETGEHRTGVSHVIGEESMQWECSRMWCNVIKKFNVIKPSLPPRLTWWKMPTLCGGRRTSNRSESRDRRGIHVHVIGNVM